MKLITRRLAAVAGTAALVSALGAGVASAQTQDGPAGGNVSAAIAVPSTLVFTFTSPTSFSVAPGATAPAAVAWTIQSNDAAGYAVTEAAPDLTGPGSTTLPAGDLSFMLHYSMKLTSGTTTTPQALTNAPASIVTEGAPSQTSNDTFAQDWTAASLPGNTPAGSYGTTIAYTAVAS